MITALSVSLSLGAALTGHHFPPRAVPADGNPGVAILTLGVALVSGMTQQTSLPLVGFVLVLVGLGTGSFFVVQMVAAQNAILHTHMGMATSVIRYFTQLGRTLGAALIGIALNSALAGQTVAGLLATPRQSEREGDHRRSEG